MSRDPGLYLLDMVEACRKVQALIKGMDLAEFSEDWRTRDAVLHNLEIIGEAVKRLPEEPKQEAPEIPWKRIAGFRDVLAHAYFSTTTCCFDRWDGGLVHFVFFRTFPLSRSMITFQP